MTKNTLTPIADRFWAKVDKSGPAFRDLGRCWLWTGTVSQKGYGTFGLGRRAAGKQVAHRVAFTLAHGEIPLGMHVDHICGIRRCVNPAHLRAVTPKENAEHRVQPDPHNKSGHRGVAWHKQTRKWSAQVYHHGKKYHLGLFVHIEDAARAASAKRAELFTLDDY